MLKPILTQFRLVDSTRRARINHMAFLDTVLPMGIYETLYAFQSSFGKYMGDDGTHPWSQGFPRTDQLPDGPPMPESAVINEMERRYPRAGGWPPFRERIAEYYNSRYGVSLSPDNVMVFAGGRPALFGVLLFLRSDIGLSIAETEYTPYYDVFKALKRSYRTIASNEENGFRPTVNSYWEGGLGATLAVVSNPCNPTGQLLAESDLKSLVERSKGSEFGVLVDEAYELFASTPQSAVQYMDNIDESNLFVAGAATKGLQAPGVRIGWLIAARENISTLESYSSFGMGGVSQLSQRYVYDLLEPSRMEQVCRAVPSFYDMQRERYRSFFSELDLDLHTGQGGFYHWCKLPAGKSAEEFNQVLFKSGAAILRGTDCDMLRRGQDSPLNSFFRFSFGALKEGSYENDRVLFKAALKDLLSA